MERYLSYDGKGALSADDIRNEASAYETLFNRTNKPKIERLYFELLNGMSGVPYDQCGDVLAALEFLQEISAAAQWKYHQNVGGVVEGFVRNFDRLDVPGERVRLYETAQEKK